MVPDPALDPVIYGLFLMLVITLSIIWTDIHHRRIGNGQVLIVAVLSLILTEFHTFSLWPWITALVVGCLLFYHRLLAGGDVKLILAYLTGIPVPLWYELALVMAFLGGLQAVIWLAASRFGGTFGGIFDTKERGLPYGVTIGATGLCGIALSVLGT